MKILSISGVPYMSQCAIEEHASNVIDFLLNVAMFNEVRHLEYNEGRYKTFEGPLGIRCYVAGTQEHWRKETLRQIKEWTPDVVHSSYMDFFLYYLKEKFKDIKIGFHCWEPTRPEGEPGNLAGLYFQVDYVLFAMGDYLKRCPNTGGAKNLHYIGCQYDPLYAPTEEELARIDKKLLVSCYGALQEELKKPMFEKLFLKPSMQFPLKFSCNWGGMDYFDAYKRYVATFPHLPHSKLYQRYSESFYGLQIYGWIKSRLSLGAKPIEQAASGCATLVQKNPDVEEVVIHGKTGFIVENTEDVIKACELAVSNPEEVREMGLKARKFVEEKYGPKTLNEKLRRIWKI